MRISVDTNILVRMVVRDDTKQTRQALELLDQASLVAVGLVALCELNWVLTSIYDIHTTRIADFIRSLLDADEVELNRSAVEAGLRVMDAGGDFADGVIAHEGAWLGGENFVSFDKKAVKLLSRHGLPAKLL